MRGRRLILTILLLFFVWRMFVLDFAISASLLLPFSPSFPYANLMNALYPYANFLIRFANFDGVHYLTIMRDGYGNTLGIQAFFPVFPLVLKALYAFPGLDYRVFSLGLGAVHVFFLASLYVFYKLVKRDFSERVALGTLITLLTFPTSLFFGALYTESLFFLLVVLVFWFAGEKKWMLAAVCAAIASATRIVGVFLLPALFVEFFSSQGIQFFPIKKLRTKETFRSVITIVKQQWKMLVLLCTSISGLLLYMGYLWYRYGDPILFANVQAGFGAGRSTHAVIYPQVVWRAFKIIATNSVNLRYITSLQEFFAGTVGLLGILWAGKHVRLSWIIFSLGCFLFPPLSGTFSSMSRYILVCFPLFILGGILFEKKPFAAYFVWIASALLLAVNTVLFIQGYWVA